MQQSGLAMWKKGNLKPPRPRTIEPPRYTSRQHCPKTITFIKAGERHSLQQRSVTGLLTSANDCQLRVDMVKQLSFQHCIAPTTLRQDMVFFSNSTKQAFPETAFQRKVISHFIWKNGDAHNLYIARNSVTDGLGCHVTYCRWPTVLYQVNAAIDKEIYLLTGLM